MGGFVGDFASQIFEKYGCTVYVFEPSHAYYEHCKTRFDANDKIIPLNYGLSDQDEKLRLSDDGDGASVFLDKDKTGELIELRAIGPEMQRLGIKQIDLMKLNIEGSEFPLLREMLDQNLVESVRFLQIQFHDFIAGAPALRQQIRDDLSATHQEQWCFFFLWESWQLRK